MTSGHVAWSNVEQSAVGRQASESAQPFCSTQPEADAEQDVAVPVARQKARISRLIDEI